MNFTGHGGRRERHDHYNKLRASECLVRCALADGKGYQVEFKIMKSSLLKSLDGATGF